jgi:hypothetical protein
MTLYRYALESRHPDHWHTIGDDEITGPRRSVGLCMHVFRPLLRRSDEPPKANLCLGCVAAARFREQARREGFILVTQKKT